MVQKIHDFRTAHRITFSWHHFLAASLLMISELTIHALEIHMLAILTTIGVFAKDVIRDIIEKCEDVCDVHHDK